MATKNKPIIAMSASVEIQAAAADGTGPAKFTSTFYTGGALKIAGWDQPVVVDLAGLRESKVLVANLDHDRTKRVGNFAVANDGKSLVANGTASAATPSRDEVVNSAAAGYQWQASLEVDPLEVEEVKAGKQVEANGQAFTGPLYVTRRGTLKGFAFVSHGADDNTTASIAASSATNKEKIMSLKPEVKAWAEKVYAGVVDLDALTADQTATIEANYAGLPKPAKTQGLQDGILARQADAERIQAITDHALSMCDRVKFDFNAKERMTAINELAQQAIEAKWGFDKYRLEVIESGIPLAQTVQASRSRDRGLNNKVIEAAICQAGRLDGHEEMFDDPTLQAAHDRFKGRIGLKQLFLLSAQANGYHEHNLELTLDVQRAAFGMHGPQQIHAQGFSTLDISTILSNTANKFIMRGWNMVDRTCLEIAKIQNVRDFKTATTVSLTDSVLYEKVGAAGEIKHGSLGQLSYTVKADTYAKMLAITRQDMINDDLGALTDVPTKLGNGAIKILNSIFWTEFLGLVGASFFASNNSNINTGVADMTVGGLDATETIFMNQTNPDGTPLGILPKILLVPTALKNKALALVADGLLVTGATSATIPAQNVFAGRFKVLSSPYISNSSYTGYTSQAWWMLADPNEMPVIAIAALNGRVEPTVDTADADFNTLGVQMRGYSDVGVNDQEYRGGVHADGNAS